MNTFLTMHAPHRFPQFCFLLTGSEEKTWRHFSRDVVHKPNTDITTLIVLMWDSWFQRWSHCLTTKASIFSWSTFPDHNRPSHTTGNLTELSQFVVGVESLCMSNCNIHHPQPHNGAGLKGENFAALCAWRLDSQTVLAIGACRPGHPRTLLILNHAHSYHEDRTRRHVVSSI